MALLVTVLGGVPRCAQAPDRMGEVETCNLLKNETACVEAVGCIWRPQTDSSRCSQCDIYVDPVCMLDCPKSIPPPILAVEPGKCTASPGFESLNEACSSMNNNFMECAAFNGCLFRFEKASSHDRCQKCEHDYDWMCDTDCPQEETYAETSLCCQAPGYENLTKICFDINDAEKCLETDGCVTRPPQASSASRCSTCDPVVDPMCHSDCLM